MSADTERDERRELLEAERDERTAAGEARAEREYWQDVGHAPHELAMLEAERWSR